MSLSSFFSFFRTDQFQPLFLLKFFLTCIKKKVMTFFPAFKNYYIKINSFIMIIDKLTKTVKSICYESYEIIVQKYIFISIRGS